MQRNNAAEHFHLPGVWFSINIILYYTVLTIPYNNCTTIPITANLPTNPAQQIQSLLPHAHNVPRTFHRETGPVAAGILEGRATIDECFWGSPRTIHAMPIGSASPVKSGNNGGIGEGGSGGKTKTKAKSCSENRNIPYKMCLAYVVNVSSERGGDIFDGPLIGMDGWEGLMQYVLYSTCMRYT